MPNTSDPRPARASAPADTPTVAINRDYAFEAAHILEWHKGKCSSLHGHSYRLKIAVEGPLDLNGVVMDFADLDATVKPNVIDVLDHTFLNDIVSNPTAERVALFIWAELNNSGLNPAELWLWETAKSSVHLRAPLPRADQTSRPDNE